jgi:hypothetical protein
MPQTERHPGGPPITNGRDYLGAGARRELHDSAGTIRFPASSVTLLDTSTEAPSSVVLDDSPIPRVQGVSATREREKTRASGCLSPGRYPIVLRAGQRVSAPERRPPPDVDVGQSRPGRRASPILCTLCLHGGRFKAVADWNECERARTGWGKGTGVSLTPDSGYLWFFKAPASVEVVVQGSRRLLDDAVASLLVSFAAGLTNVESKPRCHRGHRGSGAVPALHQPYRAHRMRPWQDPEAFALFPDCAGGPERPRSPSTT